MKHVLLCGLILLFAGMAFAQAPAPEQAEPALGPSVLTTLTEVPALWDVNSGWSAVSPEGPIEMNSIVAGDRQSWLLAIHIRVMGTMYKKAGTPYMANFILFQGDPVAMVLIDQATNHIRFAIKVEDKWYLAKETPAMGEDAQGAEGGTLSFDAVKMDGTAITAELTLQTVVGPKAVYLKFPLK